MWPSLRQLIDAAKLEMKDRCGCVGKNLVIHGKWQSDTSNCPALKRNEKSHKLFLFRDDIQQAAKFKSVECSPPCSVTSSSQASLSLSNSFWSSRLHFGLLASWLTGCVSVEFQASLALRSLLHTAEEQPELLYCSELVHRYNISQFP